MRKEKEWSKKSEGIDEEASKGLQVQEDRGNTERLSIERDGEING